MPKPTAQKANSPEAKKTKLNLQLRTVLGEAYAVVMGSRYAESVSAVTLETLMREQIEQIEGTDGVTSIRPNKKARVEKILEQTKAAVEQVKKLPPSYFKFEEDDRLIDDNQANTPEKQ
jgi:hypothetical protein